MIAISLVELKKLVAAELLQANENVIIQSVSTDSRQIDAGALFVALKGERFDGHEYAQLAKEKGAAALLVSSAVDCALPQLVVDDTKKALGQIAAWVKKECDVKTVAITGSCGKTTVKEMLASILSQKGKTLYTAENFNNEIGVPLTLLRLEPSDEFAVIELGANHLGEIAYTTALVKPDVALVTNLTAAHLEGFGSLEGVAQAKGEIFQGLKQGATAIVNLDSRADWVNELADKELVTVGLEQGAIYAKNLQALPDGCYQFDMQAKQGEQAIQLTLPGKHNVANALLAAAAALSIGKLCLKDIAQGLAKVAPVKGRGAISFPRKGLRLIDDSYNASFSAMTAAVDLLDSFDSEKIIILADMAEMGEHSDELHKSLALHVKKSSIQKVLTFGPASRVISDMNQGMHFTSQAALIEHLVDLMNTENEISVLVKGANGMKMSNIVSAIEEAAQC